MEQQQQQQEDNWYSKVLIMDFNNNKMNKASGKCQ
jgi:hypothetical protein